jgi:hypothetical protein
MSAELTTTNPAAIIPAGSKGVQLTSLEDMFRFARAVSNSGLAPKGIQTPEAIMIAVQYGLEIGLSPMAALQSISVINGRPTVWGDAALALCQGHADFEDIEETVSDGVATCKIKRKGRAECVRQFSEADAKKAGLWGKSGPWQQYPNRMLQVRARSFALRDTFADILKGIGISEEVRDYSATTKPEIKKAEGLVLPDPEPTQQEPEPQPETIEIETSEEKDADGNFKF